MGHPLRRTAGFPWGIETFGRIGRDDIPVYLCGGGSRHSLHQRLTQANNHSFYSWMRVSFRALNKPSNLDAPGLSRLDFDRLSVAYGLSFLDVSKVVKAIPRPPGTLRGRLESYA